MKLSIIIPVFNESEVLEQTLSSLPTSSFELVVVDGGSTDHTVKIAAAYTDRILASRRGRGLQQHLGACRARGEVFLFLHADTFLPARFEILIRSALADPSFIMGAFRVRFFPSNAWLRLVARVANLRSRILKLPYGDQGLFVRRSDYFRVGGFKDLPIMEDVDLVRRLTKLGKLKIIPAEVRTSARRWEKQGFLLTTLRNWTIMMRYLSGSSPSALKRHYSDVR
jgi:rSAM/selenodomain-associated transferase 2